MPPTVPALDPSALLAAAAARNWPLLFAPLMAVAAFLVRALTSSARWPWLHSKAGAVCITIFASALAAASTALGASRSWLAAGINAGVAAVTALVAVANPSLQQPPSAPAVKAGGIAGLAFLLFASLGLSACASGWTTVNAVATAGHVAVAEFRTYDAAHKREILGLHPECHTSPSPVTCYAAAIATYEAQRAPVLAAAAALAPVLAEADADMKAATEPGADVIAALAARLGAAVAAVLQSIATLRGAP